MNKPNDAIGKALEEFLDRSCPNPPMIRGALERIGLRSIVDKSPGEIICQQGALAEAYWLILDGQVEIRANDKFIRTRGPGELIGEQAYLKTLVPGASAIRTASVTARDNVRLLCIDAAFHEQMSAEERAVWFLTFAVVANEKLEQATLARAQLQGFVDDRNSLLTRFLDETPLGMVKLALDAGENPIDPREAIIWPAPGSEDTEIGVLVEPEVDHGKAEVHTGVQA